MNQPFAFFGFKFQFGRRFLPTCYSLRNRFSTSYVMLSWRFEGSNDMINWQLLDTRYHDMHDSETVEHMSEKGAASTWGIDLSLYEKIGFEGFQAFRVVQIDVNSGGTHNLCISNIELYGRPSNPETWHF